MVGETGGICVGLHHACSEWDLARLLGVWAATLRGVRPRFLRASRAVLIDKVRSLTSTSHSSVGLLTFSGRR